MGQSTHDASHGEKEMKSMYDEFKDSITRRSVLLFSAGLALGVAVTYPAVVESKTKFDYCVQNLKEKDITIKQMMDDLRTDAIAREKSIAAQRDQFIEMLRTEFQKLSSKPTPVIEYRYRTNKEEK
jgi:hypothetical protein